jgi:hypothetical protein
MTIFDILSSILYTKKPIELNLENEKEFNLFMVNRWISMHSPEKAALINSTTNKWWSLFDTKQDQFDFLMHLLSKNKYKKIDYIKKAAKQKKADEEKQMLEKTFANNNFMSTKQLRELQSMMHM